MLKDVEIINIDCLGNIQVTSTIIGAGDQGTVYEGLTDNKQIYAVKTYSNKLEADISIKMSQLGVGPLVYGVTDKYIVMKKYYASLDYFTSSEDQHKTFNPKYKLRLDLFDMLTPDIKKQLDSHVKIMHESNIIHNDIGRCNILFEPHGESVSIVLCDFGCSFYSTKSSDYELDLPRIRSGLLPQVC